jgi:hypothetical protein
MITTLILKQIPLCIYNIFFFCILPLLTPYLLLTPTLAAFFLPFFPLLISDVAATAVSTGTQAVDYGKKLVGVQPAAKTGDQAVQISPSEAAVQDK